MFGFLFIKYSKESVEKGRELKENGQIALSKSLGHVTDASLILGARHEKYFDFFFSSLKQEGFNFNILGDMEFARHIILFSRMQSTVEYIQSDSSTSGNCRPGVRNRTIRCCCGPPNCSIIIMIIIVHISFRFRQNLHENNQQPTESVKYRMCVYQKNFLPKA